MHKQRQKKNPKILFSICNQQAVSVHFPGSMSSGCSRRQTNADKGPLSFLLVLAFFELMPYGMESPG